MSIDNNGDEAVLPSVRFAGVLRLSVLHLAARRPFLALQFHQCKFLTFLSCIGLTLLSRLDMERSEPDGHEARAGSAKQESGNKQVEEKVPNFPLHLKHELLPAIHEIWQERVRVKVSRRGMATFVGAERADVEEAIRQYEDLRRKAEEKYRALSKLYTEEVHSHSNSIPCLCLTSSFIITITTRALKRSRSTGLGTL